jgi:hypothetical protein
MTTPRPKSCAECGAPFTPGTFHGEFCGARWAVRGAELYDLFMTLRYDRETGRALKVWKILCRMAAGYRAEDLAGRAGRPSWRPARIVLARRPDLQATVVAVNVAGVRR